MLSCLSKEKGGGEALNFPKKKICQSSHFSLQQLSTLRSREQPAGEFTHHKANMGWMKRNAAKMHLPTMLAMPKSMKSVFGNGQKPAPASGYENLDTDAVAYFHPTDKVPDNISDEPHGMRYATEGAC